MTNLEGRVILRQQAIAPPSGVRSDLDVIAGLAERLASPVEFAHRPRGRSSTSSGRASAGGPADYSGISYQRILDEHGVFWPCPDGPDTRDAADVPRRVRHADGRARFHVGRAPRPGRAGADGDYPGAPHDRAGARALPVRRADPAGPRPRRRPARSSSCTRCWPAGSASSTGSPCRHDPARRDVRARAGGHDDPAGHGLRAVPLGRRQPADQRRARPGQPDAGVQGLRRGGERHERRASGCRGRQRHGRPPVCVEELVAAGGHERLAVTVLGDEPLPAYNRILLVRRARGHPPGERAHAQQPEWYAEHGIDLRLGQPGAGDRPRATRGHARRRHAASRSTGWCSRPAASRRCRRSAAWSGSTAAAPEGARVPQRWPTADAARADGCYRGARARRRRRRRAARAPGRPRARRLRGLATEVVEGTEHLLSAQVGAAGGGILARDLRRLGTEVYTGTRAVRLTDEGLRLDNGFVLETDLVVLAAGGRPSTALARRAGLMVRRGVVVDGRLRSVTDERIHAIGDCAEHRGRDHRLRAARLGAGGTARPQPDRRARGVRREPHRRAAAGHRPRRRRARRPGARGTGRWSR